MGKGAEAFGVLGPQLFGRKSPTIFGDRWSAKCCLCAADYERASLMVAGVFVSVFLMFQQRRTPGSTRQRRIVNHS